MKYVYSLVFLVANTICAFMQFQNAAPGETFQQGVSFGIGILNASVALFCLTILVIMFIGDVRNSRRY